MSIYSTNTVFRVSRIICKCIVICTSGGRMSSDPSTKGLLELRTRAALITGYEIDLGAGSAAHLACVAAGTAHGRWRRPSTNQLI